MKIKVGFSTTDSLFSRLIRFCTRSKVSHTYIYVHDDFFDEPFVLHVERTMHLIRAEDFYKENRPVEEFTIEDERLALSMKENLKHLGKKFNWWDWAGWFPLVRRWVKVKLKSPTHSFPKLICVSYVLRVLNDAKITKLPYGVMTPELLRQWFNHYHEDLGWKKESFE
jgi:hypothetical protein